MPQLLLILVVGTVVILLWRLVVGYERRRRVLTELALRLNLRFSASGRVHALERIGDFYIGQQGHSARAFNVIHGQRGERRFFACDYRYELGSGPGCSSVHRTVLVWRQSRELPSIIALSEGTLHGWGRFPDFRRVRVRDSAFAARFAVYSDDPDHAELILSEGLCRNLLRCEGIDWEFSGYHVVMYTRNELSPAETGCLMWRGSRCCDVLEGKDAPRRLFGRAKPGCS